MMPRTVIALLIFTVLFGCSASQDKKPVGTDWAKGIVWYQIFPERFNNGDPSNDPVFTDVQGRENMPGWKVSPWTDDWFKLQPWEAKHSDDFYKSAFFRMYGGDLQGIIQKLDYLQDLGVQGIYFNPLFESPSLHKYNGDSYHHIDDNFGPNPARDKKRLAQAAETVEPETWIWTSADSMFLELIREMHKRDMKIVIDGVFNHLGDWSFVFKDVKENQQNSRYKDWFDVEVWDDPTTEQNEFKYKGWWGVETLPEFAEDSLGLLSGPREYVFAATQRWMDPNGDGNPEDGVDGWRLDVAEEVALPFWHDWNALVKSINPAAITVAEIWNNASEWIHSGAFDGTMNYQLTMAVVDFFVDRKSAITAIQFAERLEELNKSYGPEVSSLLWNLMDSHDTDRLASMIVNPDRDFDRDNRLNGNPDYDVRKPNNQELKVLKQIAAFQMTNVGAPMIYYGTEAGMWGADDPDERKPMLWQELKYENEDRHPLQGKSRPDDLNKFDDQLYQFYRKVILLRKQNPVLALGDFKIVPEMTSESVFVFTRSFKTESALVLFNVADEAAKVEIPGSTQYIDAWNGSDLVLNMAERNLEIPERGFRILFQK